MANSISEVLKKAIRNMNILTNSTNIILNISDITKKALENINDQEKILTIVPDNSYLQMFNNIQTQINSLESNESFIKSKDQLNNSSK